jgi:hypothetical protein
MPHVQQPEMRRSGQTRLVQDNDGPQSAGRRSRGGERRRPTALTYFKIYA